MAAKKKCIVYLDGEPHAVRYVDDELPDIFFDIIPPDPDEVKSLPPCNDTRENLTRRPT